MVLRTTSLGMCWKAGWKNSLPGFIKSWPSITWYSYLISIFWKFSLNFSSIEVDFYLSLSALIMKFKWTLWKGWITRPTYFLILMEFVISRAPIFWACIGMTESTFHLGVLSFPNLSVAFMSSMLRSSIWAFKAYSIVTGIGLVLVIIKVLFFDKPAWIFPKLTLLMSEQGSAFSFKFD